MPIYEYHCPDCDHTFPKLQAMSADSRGIPCPNCRGTNTSRKLSAFASSSGSSTTTAGSTASCGGSGFS